ncbi:uncharacterized protein N7459_001073 [Penicillium hispanicum]|uniref:uncharacterized protein n=1 Tax=Penicillium hispanicum TaxID=1080232 RepID=UPI0025424821|nr:uncharacterized protein N7459_001073 [Penicillium hispanicum]KAJ5594865.1 hypothetical protein N7459_001073 [Penicillium hispanicum]
MAYDGYHHPSPNPYYPGNVNTSPMSMNMNPDPNDPHGYAPSPPYPSRYEPEYIMPQPQMPPQMPPATSSAPNLEQPYPEPPRPQNSGNLNDAVSSAMNNVDSSAYLSPDVVSQITATVIQQLKATGLDGLQQPGPPPSRPQSQQPPWSTPDLAPPRPHSESPPTAHRSGSMPSPNPMYNSFESSQPYSVPSSYSSDTRANPKPSSDSFSVRKDSISSQGSQKTEGRPKPPSRDATVMEMTTLEKIWGKLFEDGKPTKRLGQFLRGIALHLAGLTLEQIEDYSPGNTIVIVPEKLQKFYSDTHIPSDPYPWQDFDRAHADIFDDRTSSISRLFREVKAQHHLVQTDDLRERPDIPALTPKGFERWETLMILANPEREYERLQKAVLNMPISNPDDRKERFPKEIPRRLFPEFADISLREETEEYIMKHCGVDLPHITDEERSQASRPKTQATSGGSSAERSRSYERGRPPASASSSSAVIDDEDEPIPPAPIERERKPYSANPGGGKVYDEPGNVRSHTDSFSTARPPDISTSIPKPGPRTADKYDRDSLYGRSGGPAPDRRFSKGSRSSSRGMNRSGDYRHSESDLLGRDHVPRYGGVSAGDLYMESPTSILPTDIDESRRYRDHHGHRGSRTGVDEDYYRGMLGGHGGGPVHEYKYYK